MTADPPWLDEAANAARNAKERDHAQNEMVMWRNVARAVLAFAASQPRPITDEMVEAAAAKIAGMRETYLPEEIARAALEATEIERCK